MSLNWYVVHAYSNFEHKVASSLKERIKLHGLDGKFGKRAPKFISSGNSIGLDTENDPDAKDDYVDQNELVFPVDKPVIATILSMDVIHSFGVGALRMKQDAIPGMQIPIWWKANKTGKFDIACSQLCGNGHTAMKGDLRPVSNADYAAWQKEWWPQPEAAPAETAVPVPSPAASPAATAPAPKPSVTATPAAATSPAAPAATTPPAAAPAPPHPG